MNPYAIRNLDEYFDLKQRFGAWQEALQRWQELTSQLGNEANFYPAAILAHENGVLHVQVKAENGKYLISLVSTYSDGPAEKPEGADEAMKALNATLKGESGRFYRLWTENGRENSEWSLAEQHKAEQPLHMWWKREFSFNQVPNRKQLAQIIQFASNNKWMWARVALTDFLSLFRVNSLLESHFDNFALIEQTLVEWAETHQEELEARERRIAENAAKHAKPQPEESN